MILTDTFDPALTGLTVTYNGDAWTEGDNYTYDAATGTFATIAGQITVPAATYTQETDGTYTVTPGTTTVTVTGTVKHCIVKSRALVLLFLNWQPKTTPGSAGGKNSLWRGEKRQEKVSKLE